jgi:hypothetical protein
MHIEFWRVKLKEVYHLEDIAVEVHACCQFVLLHRAKSSRTFTLYSYSPFVAVKLFFCDNSVTDEKQNVPHKVCQNSGCYSMSRSEQECYRYQHMPQHQPLCRFEHCNASRHCMVSVLMNRLDVTSASRKHCPLVPIIFSPISLACEVTGLHVTSLLVVGHTEYSDTCYTTRISDTWLYV